MTTTLATITADLEAAREDLALLERLNSAPARVAQLTTEQELAQAAHDKAQAEAQKAASAARFDGLKSIEVADVTSANANVGDGVLWRSFRITVTKLAYHMSTQPVEEKQVYNGFETVPANVFAFLIEKHPAKIPPPIAALAPGDPYRAFDEFFISKQRGYIRGPRT